MRKLILFLLSLTLSASVSGQSCCDRDGNKDVPGMGHFLFPGYGGNPIADGVGAAATTILLDAAGEMGAMYGYLHINGSPATAKNCTASGGCSISWRAGTISGFAGGDDSIQIGIQDLGTTTTPAQPDETFGVSGTFVGNVDPPTTAAWNISDMETDGDDTSYSQGDLIAIVWNLSACNGCSVVATGATSSASSHIPGSALKTGGTWAALASVIPNAVITFDDGTLGWIDGSVIFSTTGTSGNFNTGSTPDEIGMCFTVPTVWRVDALYANVLAAAGADAEIILYRDATTATPVAMKTIAFDDDFVSAASSLRLNIFGIAEQILKPGVTYAVTLRPTTANNNATVQQVLGNAAHQAAWGGTTAYGCSRSDNAGAFSSMSSNTVVNDMGVRVSGTK